jgi:hypothetical protein
MVQQKYHQNFFHILIAILNKEHGEVMLLIDVKMQQKLDIKFE